MRDSSAISVLGGAVVDPTSPLNPPMIARGLPSLSVTMAS